MKLFSMMAALSLFGVAASFGVSAAPAAPVAPVAPAVSHEVSDSTLVLPDQNNATPVCVFRPGVCYNPDCTVRTCLIKHGT